MMALATLAGVVLAGVVVHGAWQARKAGPKLAAPQPTNLEQREPVMDDLAPGWTDDAVDGPVFADVAGQVLVRRQNKRLASRLDVLIDAIATLRIDLPLSGAVVLPHLPATRRAGGKPFAIEGLNSETSEWEALVGTQRYGEFQAGVQLASRTGALNEIEYSEFVQKAQVFADAIGAMADFPDMLEAVSGARELDQFASQHDAQLAVHLRASSAAWSIGYIQQNARQHGFVPGVVPGRLVMPSSEEGAPPVLTLTFDSLAALADDPDMAAVRDVTLNFDVPQTDPKADPFAAWQAAAQALSLTMDAHIVDDDGRALGPPSFDAIGAQLGQLYEQLAARDVAAGSAAARRLFS